MSYLELIALLVTFTYMVAAAPVTEDRPDTLAVLQWRLPTNIKPILYNITLQPYLREADEESRFSFDGNALIEIQSEEPFQEIVLHKNDLTISSMEVFQKDSSNPKLPLTEVSYIDETHIWTIRADSLLNANIIYVLNFTYIGKMGDDMLGFYRSSYVDENNNTKWLGSTQFETYHARRAFPSFDEPNFKSKFTLCLIRHKSMKTISNTEQVGSRALGNDWYKDDYETSPQMSTYLVAFIFSEFNERFDGQFGVVARPEYYGQTAYAHFVGQEILKELDQYLGINYYEMGIGKMHMAAIPDFSAGAMENWGLLTYRERGLLYDSSTTTLKDKQYIAAVVAHEQTHMWFGDYVTCDWWSYAWLNEGFARFFQYYATHNVDEDYQMDKQFTVDQIQSVMNMDSTNATNPLSDENTNTFADLGRMFNSITYNKGASFIRMTKYIMGDEPFQKSLNEYLVTNKYSNTKPQHLLEQWKKYWPIAHAAHLDEYFKTFTEQVGYPVITLNVTAFGKSSGFVLSQKRFLLKDDDGSDNSLIYRIPFTYTTSAEKNFSDTTTKAFLTGDSLTHDHESNFTWVVANVQQVGYYRVNYDVPSWHKIHSALYKENFDDIHELNRAQIVDDLLNLARAGHVDYETAFDVLDFLRYETHYATWTAAFNGFNYLSIRMGTDQEAFANYILSITEKAYNTLGFAQKTNDTSLEIYNRAKVIAWVCKYGHADCINDAKSYFQTLKTVPVNIRSAVYCTGIREGNDADFDSLWNHCKDRNVATETTLILNALGCTKDQKLIEKYFNMILSDDIRRQDKSAALTSLYSENNENVDPVFNLVTANVDALSEAMGGLSSVANVIANIAARFTKETQLNSLRDFNGKNENKFGASYDTLKKAEATVANNLNWAGTNIKTVKDILIKRGSNGSACLSSVSAITMLVMVCIALCLK